MNAETTAERVGDEAQAWIKASFSDPTGKSYWQNHFSDDNMETAYCAGYAAGLAFARRVFMEDPTHFHSKISVDVLA